MLTRHLKVEGTCDTGLTSNMDDLVGQSFRIQSITKNAILSESRAFLLLPQDQYHSQPWDQAALPSFSSLP